MLNRKILLTAVTLVTAGDSTGPDGPGAVELRFRTSSVASAAQVVADQGPMLAQTIAGTNGSLSIQSIHLVVGKFKLEGSDEACPDTKAERDADKDWPKDASMVVVGTFTPKGGTARSFRTFVEAEVEIELDLVPPFTVGGDGASEVTVVLDPAMWFRTGAGAVLDLSTFNTVDRRLKLEVELKNGFVKTEIKRR